MDSGSPAGEQAHTTDDLSPQPSIGDGRFNSSAQLAETTPLCISPVS
jgi:hypothetical protein